MDKITPEGLREEAVAVERMHGETLTVEWRTKQAAQLRAHAAALEELADYKDAAKAEAKMVDEQRASIKKLEAELARLRAPADVAQRIRELDLIATGLDTTFPVSAAWIREGRAALESQAAQLAEREAQLKALKDEQATYSKHIAEAVVKWGNEKINMEREIAALKNRPPANISQAEWDALRAVLPDEPHEHADGCNECSICDESLVSAATRTITALTKNPARPCPPTTEAIVRDTATSGAPAGGTSYEHIAWCRYKAGNDGRPATIHLCDSDDKGAFKVYRAAYPKE